MKICVIANASAVHTQRWASGFAERGHQVDVLSIRRAHIPGVVVHTLAVGRPNTSNTLWTLLSYVRLLLQARPLLKRLAPDIVHAHFTVTHGVIATLTGRHPLVMTTWGRDVVGPTGRQRNILWRSLNRFVLRRADLVTVTSRYMIDHVRELAGRPINLERVPFGVDCVRFSPAGNSNPTGNFHIGFVKHLRRKYGPADLIAAMPEVLAAVPNAQLTMAGDGPLRAELGRQAISLGVHEAIRFLGRVPHDEVPHLLQSLDVLVNPSVEDSETFGVVLIEAGACGIPVIATSVGGVPEVVHDGETGWLVPPRSPQALAEKLIELAGDPEQRIRMGDAGRRRVLDSYDWVHNVDSMETLITNIADPGRSPRLTWVRTSARRLETLPLVNRTVRPALRWAWDLLWHAIIQIRVLRGGPVAVLDLDVGEVTVDLRDTGVARPLCRYREYEPDERSAMRQLVVPGMHVVDIGAQIGYHTLLLSQLVGDDGRVLAIEAAPDNFTLLEHNIQHNGRANVTAVNVAAADRPGELNLAIDPSNLGAHHVVRSASGTDAIAVSAETVDAIANSEQLRPQFVKMDIEGGEVTALHGMATMIDGEDMTFLAELNGAALERAGTSSAALLVEFADHGYQFFSVETGGRLSRTSQEALLAAAGRRPNLNFVAARGPALLRIKNALEH